jgi:hypothetical protein
MSALAPLLKCHKLHSEKFALDNLFKFYLFIFLMNLSLFMSYLINLIILYKKNLLLFNITT